MPCARCLSEHSVYLTPVELLAIVVQIAIIVARIAIHPDIRIIGNDCIVVRRKLSLVGRGGIPGAGI